MYLPTCFKRRRKVDSERFSLFWKLDSSLRRRTMSGSAMIRKCLQTFRNFNQRWRFQIPKYLLQTVIIQNEYWWIFIVIQIHWPVQYDIYLMILLP